MTVMDIQEILTNLPHRYPFLLIDRVIALEPGKKIIALKNVTFNEPFFMGHFPERAVMPGVLILEAMAQTAGVLAKKSIHWVAGQEYLHLLVGIDNARFKRMVVPGDQLRIEVELIKMKQDIFKFTGTAMVEDSLACSADFISARKAVTHD